MLARSRLYQPLVICAAVMCIGSFEAYTPVAAAPQRQGAAAAARSVTMNVTVTDSTGTPIPGAQISVTGPVTRDGVTSDAGALRLLGIRPGTYRLRFEHEGYVTLERELAVTAGKAASVDVTLSEAAPAPAPEPALPAPEEGPGEAPAGEPRATNLANFVEKNFIGSRDPQREDEIGCTASARTTLLQLRDNTREEARADADEVIYVIAGEGTLRLGNKDVPLESSVTAVIPRGTVRAISRKGRNPLIVLSVVSGPACTK